MDYKLSREKWDLIYVVIYLIRSEQNWFLEILQQKTVHLYEQNVISNASKT